GWFVIAVFVLIGVHGRPPRGVGCRNDAALIAARPACANPTVAPSITLVRNVQHLAAGLAVNRIRIMSLQPASGARKGHLVWPHDRLGEADKQRYPDDHRDRKSTRLNSSHVKISYAVFCL